MTDERLNSTVRISRRYGTLDYDAVIDEFGKSNGRLQFLRASAMLKHVIDIGWTSVRPSVRHTLARYQNG